MKRTKGELLSNTNNVKNSKFVANNTLRIEYNDGTIAIRLHNTDIITYCGNEIILNSGGWRTQTTKDRINSFCPPAHISQVKGLWYLRNGSLFYDGCKIDDEGNLISKVIKVDDKKITRLKKQIADYCKLITKDNLPYPDGGDCWYCSFHDKIGAAMGDLSENYSHLTEHLKEKYLHGSILVNAMREAGYKDNQIGFHYQLKLADTFRRVVRRYLQKRLISNIAVK
jgi:hypothetical protein